MKVALFAGIVGLLVLAGCTTRLFWRVEPPPGISEERLAQDRLECTREATKLIGELAAGRGTTEGPPPWSAGYVTSFGIIGSHLPLGLSFKNGEAVPREVLADASKREQLSVEILLMCMHTRGYRVMVGTSEEGMREIPRPGKK